MKDAAQLRAQAAKCRALAKASDKMTAANLNMLAADYEDDARKLESQPTAEPPMPE